VNWLKLAAVIFNTVNEKHGRYLLSGVLNFDEWHKKRAAPDHPGRLRTVYVTSEK
jgi:hypothetical protein